MISTAIQPCVLVRSLSHCFGEGDNRKQILFSVDLELNPGSIVILTGPSGSGKTTLLTLIGALRAVQTGSVAILGRELADLQGQAVNRIRSELGFIFQHHNLFGALTAFQNVHLALETSTCPAQEMKPRALAMLERLGLGHRLHHRPDSLSGGQRQRVAIARALVHRPRLVLADEPTASLDPGHSRDVVELFQELARSQQCTILIVTHDHRLFDSADRMIRLIDGRVAA